MLSARVSAAFSVADEAVNLFFWNFEERKVQAAKTLA
jgi:hypothetical protein